MQRINVPILGILVVLAGFLLVVDLLVPLGVAVWIPYVGIVLLSLWLPRANHVYATAAACTVLVVIGLVGSEKGDAEFWTAALNRLLGIFAIWISAVVGLAARRTHELQEANVRLQREILQREQLQAQLLRTQRLESIGVLASGIAHDLNNLLTPISLAAKLLTEDRSDAERRELLETLLASAERGGDIVRQLLSFAGGAQAERTVVQIKHIVREVKAILDHTFPKNISLQVSLDDNLKPVYADMTQLTQVLMNLCVNARDAMPEGGRLTITAKNADVGQGDLFSQAIVRVGPHVAVSVSDTGSGISPAILDKVFDPFFTTKEHGKGTGLGLSTALGIIRNHDGFIDVASELGKGSRFCVYLPAYAGSEPYLNRPQKSEAPSGNGETVLFVDDEALILASARLALEDNGYRVLTASDGQEALALFHQERDDIAAAVVDVMMPVLDGTATIDALQASGQDLGIIASSGLRPRGKLSEAVAAGAIAFQQKPYTDKQLLDVLATTIHQAKIRS